jgi:hypothetical protein
MELFSVTPTVQYNGYNLLNILTKVAVIKQKLNQFDLYYPYTVHDGERPDTVAYDYYGSPTYAWLVMIVNDVADPYYDWPLTNNQFRDYLQKKYGSVYPLMSQISHYQYTGIGGQTQEEIDRVSWKMTTTTFDSLAPEEKSGWTPVTVYDAEYQVNEDKRQIKLLSNAYLKQVDREMNTIFNG